MPAAASYQMYARPETAGAAARFWTLIRTAYGAGNADLTDYADPAEAWSDPDLLLSQTCGLPFRYRLHGKVRLVGTPDYGAPGCPPGYYTSCLITRRDDPRRDLAEFRATPFARNSVLSQSGWGAIENHLAETRAGFSFRGNVLETGSHAGSARAVARGLAGLASLDAVTWGFLQRHDPVARDLKVLATTRPTPGLPLITGPTVDPEPLFQAVASAIDRLDPQDRDALAIRSIVRIPEATYLAEPLPWPLTRDA